MDDDEIVEMMNASTDTLGDDFRVQLWSEIKAGLLVPEATDRAQPTELLPAIPTGRGRRQFWVAAASIVLVCAAATALIVRNDGLEDSTGFAPATTTPSDASPSSTAAPIPSTTAVAPTTSTSIVVEPTSVPALVPDATYLPAEEPVPVLAGLGISDMKMTDPNSGWVVTTGVLAHTADGGETWQTLPILPPSNTRGSGKSFILDNDHAWVVRPGDGDTVLVTTNGDQGVQSRSFAIEPDFPGGMPAGVVFLDPGNGYVSIADPTKSSELTGRAALYRTTNGVTYDLVDPDSPVPLAFSDPLTGWAAGHGLFVTTDGGATWTQVKPPLWDTAGPDPNGPAYKIVTTTADLTVVEVRAATGTQAQVAYAATDDLGQTWRDVAPPDIAEQSNSGPQSMLTAVTASDWFGINPGFEQDATLWITTDAGASYRSIHLPFPALTISMTTTTTGWATTPTDIRRTTDGGATWTKVVDVIAPVTSADGCTWQPSYDGNDGAGQAIFDYIRITNTSTEACTPPTIVGVTADAPDGIGTITGSPGRSLPQGLPTTVAVGSRIRLQITTVSALEDCGASMSRPVTSFVIHFDGDTRSTVTLDRAIETACEFVYDSVVTG